MADDDGGAFGQTARAMPPREERGPENEVQIEHNGKTYRGRYYVSGNVVTVTWSLESRSTQIGGSAPAALARMLLKELVRDS